MQRILGHSTGLLAVGVGVGLLAAPASANFFLSYFEAPAEVEAGETFTVDLWLQYDGQFNIGGDLFSSMATSVALGGTSSSQFASTAYNDDPRPAGVIDNGVVEGSLLANIAALQLASIGPFNFDNPINLFSFDVTAGEDLGLITIQHAPHVAFDGVFVDWYFDFNDFDTFSSDDPDIDLFLESTTVRVVPAPASAAVLCAGLAFARRRLHPHRSRP